MNNSYLRSKRWNCNREFKPGIRHELFGFREAIRSRSHEHLWRIKISCPFFYLFYFVFLWLVHNSIIHSIRVCIVRWNVLCCFRCQLLLLIILLLLNCLLLLLLLLVLLLIYIFVHLVIILPSRSYLRLLLRNIVIISLTIVVGFMAL